MVEDRPAEGSVIYARQFKALERATGHLSKRNAPDRASIKDARSYNGFSLLHLSQTAGLVDNRNDAAMASVAFNSCLDRIVPIWGYSGGAIVGMAWKTGSDLPAANRGRIGSASQDWAISVLVDAPIPIRGRGRVTTGFLGFRIRLDRLFLVLA